tara:strand:+ start:5084 stop:6478 length:1395 start_codon:yes stop_codon:yes gene_type:complete
MARNRIIYQSQALFAAPSSTGYHVQFADHGTNANDAVGSVAWTGATGLISSGYNRSLIEPITRVQSANFNFTINRQDINEFGKLARIDSIVMESPTVGLDFNYYVTDGGNERKMGFNVPTSKILDGGRANETAYASTGDGCISGFSALSGLIEDTQGNNYFIVTSKEGVDVQGDNVDAGTANFDLISIGNGFISDYTLEAAVGAVPTASVTVEAFNIKVDDRISGAKNLASQKIQIPGVDDTNGEKVENYLSFNAGTINSTGEEAGLITALRPGDLTLEILDPEGGANWGTNYQGFATLSGDGKAHIQSFTVSLPMSRTILGRLGNTFGYARVIDLPMNIDVSISAIVSEFTKNNLFDALVSPNKTNFKLTMKKTNTSTGGAGDTALTIDVKGARLESETYSAAIGDNETVDISFSCQVGGSNDTDNGIFMLGTYPRFSTIPYWPLGDKKNQQGAWSGTPTLPS